MALYSVFTYPCFTRPTFFLQGSRSATNSTRSVTKVTSPINCLPSSLSYELEDSRRRANFKPNIWDHDFFQSLRSDYQDEAHIKRAEKLKEEIKYLLQEVVDPLAQLELIDAIQRLGVGHVFDEEIKEALNTIWVIHNNNDNRGGMENNDLYATSLLFRLLRQHGYRVSQDVFNKFRDESGGLIASVNEDINGILSLYEASHFAHQGETLLVKCRAFTTTYLNAFKGSVDIRLAMKIEHALELPLHWRMPRIESLWQLNIYQEEEHMNPTLLEYIILFNNPQFF